MPQRYRSLPTESPLIRLHVELPDGRAETVTISASFRPTEILGAADTYKHQLQRLVEGFLSSRGLRLTRLELVNIYTVEVGS